MFAIVICLVLLMCTLLIGASVVCVLMVEGVSVVVNVMLYIMSVMSRLWWNLQFCERSENWSHPIPSIDLGRQTTTAKQKR